MAHSTSQLGSCFGFSDLPVELKINVFAFIRSTEDRKAVCLVSRRWKEIMAPILWETFKTDLRPTFDKTLDTILHPKCGILPLVRHLRLDVVHEHRKVSMHTLEALLSVLPKDILTSIGSRVCIDSLWFKRLLQNQGRLKRIWVPIDVSDHRPFPASEDIAQANWLVSGLAEVESLEVTFKHTSAYQEMNRFLIRNTPKLKELFILPVNCGRTINIDPFLSIPDNAPRLLNLEILQVEEVDFSHHPTNLLSHIDASKLVELFIIACVNIAPLLNGFATSFSKSPPALKALHIQIRRDSNEDQDVIGAIESLLNSFVGAEGLLLDVCGLRLIGKDCIIRHRETLRQLGVCTSHAANALHYSAKDLEAILTACDKLTAIAINLPPINLGNAWDVGAGFHLAVPGCAYAKTELQLILEIIASYPGLRAFRMPSMPLIIFGPLTETVPLTRTDVWRAKVIMQHLASEIMAYLVQHGSNIKLFCTGPFRYESRMDNDESDVDSDQSDLDDDESDLDSDGHRWPNYYYLRGRVMKGIGKEQIVAQPLANAGTEMPEFELMYI